MTKTAYTYIEGAEECGYSERTMKQAAADGSLIVRYANSKPVIMHEDLVAWLKSLPTEKPKH